MHILPWNSCNLTFVLAPMDENGETSNKPKSLRPQETFQRAQETPVGQRFPNNPAGIVAVPRGSRGPRSLYLRRYGDSFGFTLRHFIVYPPDGIAEHDGRHAAVGALLAPMETIFVKHVKDRSPAKQAGLQRGDRLVAVNGVPTKERSYSQVVQLIVNSPEYLHLLVVPKEEDVLQRFFAETAYNPASNQPVYPEGPVDRKTAQQIISQRINQRPPSVQVDAISWRSLQQPYFYSDYPVQQRSVAYDYNRGQRSAENILVRDNRNTRRDNQQEIYAEIRPHELPLRQKCRAAPQVPLYKKMGRRASEGSALSNCENFETDYSGVNSGDLEDYNTKTSYKSSYLPETSQSQEMLGLNYPNTAGCRLSLDVGRRESTSSLSSSIADGSKDSIGSFGSTSTLTGHETDDSVIMSRFRKSVKQKEDFLNTPGNTVEQALIHREFYGRPKKLERAMWPPNETVRQDSPSRTTKPTHQNFLRVKNDIETERDYVAQQQYQNGAVSGGSANVVPQQRVATSPKDAIQINDCMQEAAVAPNFENVVMSGASNAKDETSGEDRRVYPPNLQLVQKRAKEFESGRAVPDDDPLLSNRMNFSRSELARLSSKKLVPNVNERAQEYEIRAVEPRRDNSGTSTNSGNSVLKRIQRDSRSLDSSDTSGNEARSIRARSNSAESWVAALGNDRGKRISRQDAAVSTKSRAKVNVDDKPVVVKRRAKNTNIAEDERAMRRESYLKATEGGRMHIDSDFSDSGDISPQALRSGSVSGNSSSSASLDREKASSSPTPLDKEKDVIIRDGTVHCKILEIDGKRATDRSWKQVWMVLKGPKLFLYKDRHHQSPVGTSDSLDQSLSSGVDMRTSVVRVAEDYTKRKNVLRVSAVKPFRSELLIQSEGSEEFADWVKTLQEQVAASTEAELEPFSSRQQAVPQVIPASTTIQVQGSHLSPQLNKSKGYSVRNRSPTGQSPVSKTRKPSQLCDPNTSPKSKTWRGRMAKQFRKFNQGANSPSSPTAPEGSTFGIPIEDCLPAIRNPYVPRFVEVCTDIIDARGLLAIGIYRVPGNNASITALSEEVNRNYEEVPLDDPRWNDLHVVSSLLKSYFRKMPDSLVTIGLYPHFIKADKKEDPKARLEELRRLVRSLPKHNYHTLKHIVLHLKRIADNSDVNKMEAKNLAIVFGPTIVRPEGENMESMVNNMNNQCKIVESLLTNAEWFFPENSEHDEPPEVPLALPYVGDEFEMNNQALLNNISKYQALNNPKEKNGALLSSIISAAQRKVKRKPTKGISSLQESKDEPSTPTTSKVFPQEFSPTDFHECTNQEDRVGPNNSSIPITVMEIEKRNKPAEKMPWFNYSTDKADFERRIQNFKQETEAMLQRPRKTEISVPSTDTRTGGQLSSSAGNVNHNARLSLKPTDLHLLTKTHSASNVFTRTVNVDNSRNSLNSMDSSFSVQYKNAGDRQSDNSNFSYASASIKQFNSNRDNNSDSPKFIQGGYSETDSATSKNSRYNMRRGSSVENLNSSTLDLNSNGNLKKIKYENENDTQRKGSLDSLNKLPNDDESLLSTMTKLIDQKLKCKPATLNIFSEDDIPFVDESPQKHSNESISCDKENIPRTDLYKNPSLHKNQYNPSKVSRRDDNVLFKESKIDGEKEEDTRASENVPDNDRHISQSTKLTVLTNKINQNLAAGSKLRRSESLNKSDKSVSPLSSKLNRSDSLNKTGDKLKRSDSLTKNEKTESNNKRREITSSGRRIKESTKNKRKNGMPDRSIKRRHTVGGTKDPDKVTWLLDTKNQDDNRQTENNKEKNLRTSSPDLSSTRRERFFFEINLIGPENMVVALRQHLIGARPQSFPESTVFKVPLESHV